MFNAFENLQMLMHVLQRGIAAIAAALQLGQCELQTRETAQTGVLGPFEQDFYSFGLPHKLTHFCVFLHDSLHVSASLRSRVAFCPAVVALSLSFLLTPLVVVFLMDDYFTMQPSQGVHNEQNPGDSVSPASGYVSPLDSPTPSPPSLAPDPVVEGARTKKVLSPSELVSVLRQEVGPVPKAQARTSHLRPLLQQPLSQGSRFARLLTRSSYRFPTRWTTSF